MGASEKAYDLEQRLDALVSWTASWPLNAIPQVFLTSEVPIGFFGPIPADDPVSNVTSAQAPAPGIAFGANATGFTDMLAAGILNMGAYRGYNSPTENTTGIPAAWPGTSAGTIPAGVTTPCISLNPTGLTIASIIAGTYDTALAAWFALVPSGAMITVGPEWESSAYSYSAANVVAMHAHLWTLFHANAPAGALYGQCVSTNTAQSGNAHYPLGPWICCPANGGVALDFYALDAYLGASSSTAWSFVQKSASEATGTGNVTPAIPAPSTSGNMLVASLISEEGGGSHPFSGPAGWLLAGSVQQSGVSRSEVWYYPSNPGGISSAAFTSTGTGPVKGNIIEVANAAASYTVVVEALATPAATSGATLAAVAGNASTAGDLGVCCFHQHLSAAAAATWTTPSGYTLITDDTASAGDHMYSAYNLSTAAGTLTVTGTTASGTNVTGFTGVLAVFRPTAASGGGGTAATVLGTALTAIEGVIANPALAVWECNASVEASRPDWFAPVGAAPAIAAPPPAPMFNLRPPIGSAWFGAYPGSGNAQPGAYEGASVANRLLGLETRYEKLDGTWPSTADKAVAAAGTILAVCWSSQLSAGGYATWAQVAAGTYDAQITAQAHVLAAWGVQLFVGYDNEFDGSTRIGNSGPLTNYAAAYQHIWNIVNPIASNVVWVWWPSGNNMTSAVAAAYPGDNYVDWIAYDPYDATLSKGSPTAAYTPFMTWLAGAQMAGIGQGVGKPVGIFETGVEPTNDSGGAAWINAVPACLETLGIQAWTWFNANDTWDTIITPGSQMATALATIGASAFFNPVINTSGAMLVGAFVNPAQTGGPGTTDAAAYADFAAFTGEPLTVRRVYMGTIPASITADMIADAAAGRKVVMSFFPGWSGGVLSTTTTIYNELSAFLASCASHGLIASVGLYPEPVNNGMSSAQCISGFRYYAGAVRANNYPTFFCTGTYTVYHNSELACYPGDAYVDIVMTDYYGSAYVSGELLDMAAATANNATPPKPYGLGEFNYSTDPTNGQTAVQGASYFAYIQSYFLARQAAGLPNADLCFFSSGVAPNSNCTVITGSGDPRVALYQSLFNALNGTTSGGGGGGGGGTTSAWAWAVANGCLAFCAWWGTGYAWDATDTATIAALAADAAAGAVPVAPPGGQPGGYVFRIEGNAASPNAQTIIINAYCSSSIGPGGALIGSSGGRVTTAAFTSREWTLHAAFYFRTTGAAGAIRSLGSYADSLTNTANPGAGELGSPANTIGLSGISETTDTTRPMYVVVTAKFTNSSAANAIAALSGSMERIGRW